MLYSPVRPSLPPLFHSFIYSNVHIYLHMGTSLGTHGLTLTFSFWLKLLYLPQILFPRSEVVTQNRFSLRWSDPFDLNTARKLRNLSYMCQTSCQWMVIKVRIVRHGFMLLEGTFHHELLKSITMLCIHLIFLWHPLMQPELHVHIISPLSLCTVDKSSSSFYLVIFPSFITPIHFQKFRTM